jgi:hypothetical protein
LLANSETKAGVVDLSSVSTELFAQTVVVDAGMSPAVRTDFSQKGFHIVAARGDDELAALAELSRTWKADAVVVFPLNGQWNPKDIPRLVMTLNRGYDMVVASRFIVGGERQGKRGKLRSLGNRVFNLFANLLFAGNLSDGFSSFRAIRRSKLAAVVPSGRGLARFFALSILAMKSNWRIQEIPTVEMTKSGQQVVRDTISSTLPAIMILLKEWWSQRRLRRLNAK